MASWYRSGTVAVTNGSTLVTGAGVDFALNARAGDGFIGPDGRTYEIQNIPSPNTLGIYPGYIGATASGQAYVIAPLQGYNKESADRMRAATNEFGTLASSIQPWATADTEPQARNLLELGSASTKNVVSSKTDSTIERVLLTGSGGILGLNDLRPAGNPNPSALYSKGTFSGFSEAATFGLPGSYGVTTYMMQWTDISGTGGLVHKFCNGAEEWMRFADTGSSWSPWRKQLHTLNTTVDSNGFIKQASPISKLFSDHIENNNDAIDVLFKKINVGKYQLLTKRKLATDGWYIETPKDANGNIKVFVKYENNDLGILIETFSPVYFNGVSEAGEPMDIPEGRCIDIRMTYTEEEKNKAQEKIEIIKNYTVPN